MNLLSPGAARRAVCGAAIMGIVLSTAGCFTAFTPKRNYCTHDPKDTAVPLCKPKAPQ
ncbi:hypothetical protein RBA41_20530 [Massilia sp. CCM 9210]|uniref:hypothetical protein n=1 Tax=Massilia scottii TaxID=3057166 RepID=UPI0027969A9A|nr:hypothetical protein [Massilia sp. CCM 9210]MDQ1815686.1 hypothetical protein [Massilia sp. CCM 9210]